jgi:insertion element IS1 protein InsB
MYLEGLGFHYTARLLGVSHVSVINWARKYGEGLESIRNPRPCKVMELDEMHSYTGHKNCCWIWVGVDREAREYIDMVTEGRSTITGIALWNKLRTQATGYVATDYWKSYNEMIPREKLVQTKAETCTEESYNGQIRYFLAWFRRKTKCYSKSLEMMIFSLKLLMDKRNNVISMQRYYFIQYYQELFNTEDVNNIV